MSARADSVESWSGKDRADENFPVGSALIRRDLRAHVHAFYAFARNADDIADSATLTPDEKIARLDAMEEVLLGRRQEGSPSAARLRQSLAETRVTARHSCDLLVAFRRDATKRRYADWEELFDYCRYSAMPVGRHVLDLHDEDAATHPPSDALCTALQVLNHLQDAKADLNALDRCYLPQDLLAAHGAAVADLLKERASPRLRRTFDSLLDHASRLNEEARNLPRRTRSRRLRLETAVIVGLSYRLCRRLRREDPVLGRVRLHRADVAASLFTALRFLP
ncbi:MAG: squalene synthase HpnC [Rhodospirillales bacterium]|nr:squalene synthase HpnC [Rhodospirillales bacterium]